MIVHRSLYKQTTLLLGEKKIQLLKANAFGEFEVGGRLLGYEIIRAVVQCRRRVEKAILKKRKSCSRDFKTIAREPLTRRWGGKSLRLKPSYWWWSTTIGRSLVDGGFCLTCSKAANLGNYFCYWIPESKYLLPCWVKTGKEEKEEEAYRNSGVSPIHLKNNYYLEEMTWFSTRSPPVLFFMPITSWSKKVMSPADLSKPRLAVPQMGLSLHQLTDVFSWKHFLKEIVSLDFYKLIWQKFPEIYSELESISCKLDLCSYWLPNKTQI